MINCAKLKAFLKANVEELRSEVGIAACGKEDCDICCSMATEHMASMKTCVMRPAAMEFQQWYRRFGMKRAQYDSYRALSQNFQEESRIDDAYDAAVEWCNKQV